MGDESLGAYVVFENGQLGVITEGADLLNKIPDSAYFPDKATGEARAWIYYTAELINDLVFDGKVELEALYPIEIQLADMRLPADVDKDYKDDITVSTSNINYTRNRYVNLQLFYKSADPSFDPEHKFKLVYNADRTGFFAESYPKSDDGYLYLELYHDANDDTKKVEYSIYHCYKLTTTDANVDIDIEDYKGIKILYKSLSDNNLTVFPVKL
jgi:hypothetical protein